jgi:tRNA (guanine-N7-)-methyltransferase
MERCAALRIAEPAALKGNWRSLKEGCAQLWVEVGCGKGKFTAETAAANPDVLLIAVERCREAMVVAMEKAKEMGLTNVFYIDMDVANIEEIFASQEIDRLFINFPDPWPRKKNAKRRLTHRGFLDKYCRVVRTGGEFHFKTDNAPLFEFSVEEFAACGLQVNNLTRNLHENGIVGIMTGYEEKFHALGTPINRCEVVCKPFRLPNDSPEEPQENLEHISIVPKEATFDGPKHGYIITEDEE